MDAYRGLISVLSKAVGVASRSKKQLLPCLLLALIPSSLLLLGSHVAVYPLLLDFIAGLHSLAGEYPVTPQFYGLLVRLMDDADALCHANVALLVASYLGDLAATVAVVHASSAACAGSHLPARDLLLRLATSWKGPLVTWLYATLLSVGYTVLSVTLITVPALSLAAAGGPFSRPSVVAAAGIGLAARFLYIYLAMVWTMGVVVSVLEDGCLGLEALHRAAQLVSGRRAQGFLVALVLAFACAVHLVLGVFSPMVYTVFYHECKRSHGDGAPQELLPHAKVDHDHDTMIQGPSGV